MTMSEAEIMTQRRLSRIGKHQLDDRPVALHRKAVEVRMRSVKVE